MSGQSGTRTSALRPLERDMHGDGARRERRKVEEEETWRETLQSLPQLSGSIGRANGEVQMTQTVPPDGLIVVCSRLLAQTSKSLVFQKVRKASGVKHAKN